MSTNVHVRVMCQVNKPMMRAIELILRAPGLRFNKVVILCGGPDWPTSVLTGILRLNVFQMLLGTLPIIVLIVPCVLAGACLLIPELALLSTAIGMLAVLAQGG